MPVRDMSLAVTEPVIAVKATDLPPSFAFVASTSLAAVSVNAPPTCKSDFAALTLPPAVTVTSFVAATLRLPRYASAPTITFRDDAFITFELSAVERSTLPFIAVNETAASSVMKDASLRFASVLADTFKDSTAERTAFVAATDLVVAVRPMVLAESFALDASTLPF